MFVKTVEKVFADIKRLTGKNIKEGDMLTPKEKQLCELNNLKINKELVMK